MTFLEEMNVLAKNAPEWAVKPRYTTISPKAELMDIIIIKEHDGVSSHYGQIVGLMPNNVVIYVLAQPNIDFIILGESDE